MEGNIGIKPNESLAVSEEFEIVNTSPTTAPQLIIGGDGSLEELWESLGEMLTEESDTVGAEGRRKAGNGNERTTKEERGGKERREVENVVIENRNEESETEVKAENDPSIEDRGLLSKESEELMAVLSPSSSEPEEVLEEIADVLQDCTIFNGVSYLGSTTVNAPKSDAEIQRNMAMFNEETAEHVKVSISIPSCSDGCIVLYEEATNVVIGRFEICRILFYAHGLPESKQKACFSFTWSHGDSVESSIYQCLIFRCEIPEAVGQVSACFVKAFQRLPKSMTDSLNGDLPSESDVTNNTTQFILELTVEIKEDDLKGGYSTVTRDRSCFRLRSNMEKQICLSIKQVGSESHYLLEIKRCFGVLVAPGRHVKHSDMQLLDMVCMGNEGSNVYSTTVSWHPRGATFAELNTVSNDPVYFTLAVDLVIKGITEPVRLTVESQARIYPQNERFWYLTKRNLVQTFYINLKEVSSVDLSEPCFEVTSVETSGEVDRLNRLNLTLNSLASYISSPSVSSIDTLTPRDEYLSDSDEPLVSGTGRVSKECTVDVLEMWREVMTKWKDSRPKSLGPLVKSGIPEALRGEVWIRLANADNVTHLMEEYRILISKESGCEAMIMRDINRTFPGHEFFREGGKGKGQESLYRISKAYSVYDTEIGYCQGLSFLAATLLLHMPEEQAFCVLIKLMYDYGLRDLYRDGFECLYLRLYQLNRLMDEYLPHLSEHFRNKGVESHMFASQWFLSLFTARFPLYFVFHIIDVFLLQGTDTLFQVALALLMMCKKDLMGLDFESTLKYFRITLPKKCRNDETARNLMKTACSIKLKKLKKYEQDFEAIKEAQENVDNYTSELEKLKFELTRSEEEKKRLEDELLQIKEMLKREVQKAENESKSSGSIIAGYKQISLRLEEELALTKSSLSSVREMISKCPHCCSLEKILSVEGAFPGIEETVRRNDGEEDNLDNSSCERLSERITQLELELAKAKLCHVQAECTNQELSHRLQMAVCELEGKSTSWAPPWFSKTLSSIKEATALHRSES